MRKSVVRAAQYGDTVDLHATLRGMPVGGDQMLHETKLDASEM